ncbi:eukaryotic translation initiation factor 4 gamma 3-like [Diaphorina citri]|uniref:Eukaryotic translation initiation factor 4 gamma 3-like n=1 Tax=Diaphorina citri TaxID=121845 RepID=A0A3Q0INZ4_DIACI|nr:eukaryotic translation initiation factor 4 gamma 3-like [Diaphorina citri]
MDSLKTISDQKEREEKRLEYEDEERLHRKKSVGVMTFIGELFKLRLLHPRVVHGCFHMLLEKGNDVESLECLAKLITSTGKAVEELNNGSGPYSEMSKNSWVDVIKKVRKLVDDKNRDKIPSRLRFMILDVLDLKDRNWVPRMAENKPKTMAQIEKDIDQEAMRKNMQIRDDDRNMPVKMPNKKPQQTNQTPTQSQASQKINVDVGKLKVATDPFELSLRPNIWGSGASGFKSAAKPAVTSRRPPAMSSPAPLTHTNSFSVLSLPEAPAPAPSLAPSTPSGKGKPAAAQRTPQKKASVEKPPTPAAVKNDNAAFERSLAAASDVKDNYDIEDKYLEFLSYGPAFTDKMNDKDNQYQEEVS